MGDRAASFFRLIAIGSRQPRRAAPDGRRSRLALGLAALCALLANAGAAFAIDITSAPLPPTQVVVDQNGVNRLTGAFSFSTPSISIGSGQGALSYARRYDSARRVWEDNFLGAMHSSGNDFTLTVLGSSVKFTHSSGSYTPAEGQGGTLTYSSGSNSYTYTDRSGAVITFSKNLASSLPLNANEGLLTTIVYPSGETLSFTYERLEVSSGVFASRLMSVNNNFGYQIKFEYPSGSTWNSGAWAGIAKVTAINNAVEYCSPTANGCSLSNSWPTLTIAGGYWITSITDSLSQTTNYSYDSGGHGEIVEIERPTGVTITIGYDSSVQGRAVSVNDGAGTWSYSYNDPAQSSTRITTVTDPNSAQWISIGNRVIGRVTEQYDPIGRGTVFTYDSLNRIQTSRSPTEQVTTYTYDSRGNITAASTAPSSGSGSLSTSATYPSSCSNPVTCNLPTSTTDVRGYTTDYTYDSTHGGVLTVLAPDPDGGGSAARPQTTYTYTTKNARYYTAPSTETVGGAIYVLSSVAACSTTTVSTCSGGANETVTSYAYPSSSVLNNLLPTSTTVAAGNSSLSATTTPTYDNVRNVTAIDGPLSGSDDTMRYRYDALRRQIGVITPDPDGSGSTNAHRAIKTTLNADGQPTSVQQGTINSSFDWSSFVPMQEQTTNYNAQGRATRTDFVLRHGSGGSSSTTQSVTQYAYDNAGLLQCQAVRLNLSSIPSSACTGASGSAGADRITDYDYNGAGDVTAVTAADGTSDERTEVIHFASSSPNVGLVDYVEDGNGNRTAYEYDAYARLYRIYYPSSTLGAHAANSSDYEQFGYDNNNNVSSRRLRSGDTVSTTYDALNRATFVDMPGSQPDVTMAYDNLSRATSVSISGHSQSYAHDALSRMTSETGPLGTVSYQYDLAGRRTRMDYPGSPSLYLTYDYNNADEVTTIRENGATSGEGVLATYIYDNLGRRTSVSRANGAGATTTFTYDDDTSTWTFAHNLSGSAYDLQRTLTFNAAGQTTSASNDNSAYLWSPSTTASSTSYSRNGLNQMTAAGSLSLTYTDGRGNTTSDGMKSYGYDYTNRLTSASNGASLTYDPFGRLYQTALSGTTRRFLYDGAEIIAEYDGSNNLLRRYVRGPGVDEPIVWYEEGASPYRRWTVQDERGSVIALANNTAAMININTYDEYGAPHSSNLGRFQFTGQAWLPEVELYHYKARAYAPTLGRFLQTDPIGYGAGDMNQYSYVRNDPVNLTDPSGLNAGCIGPFCEPKADVIVVTGQRDLSLAEREYYHTQFREHQFVLDWARDPLLQDIGYLSGRSPEDQQLASDINALLDNPQGRSTKVVNGSRVTITRNGSSVTVEIRRGPVAIRGTGVLVNPANKQEVSITELRFRATSPFTSVESAPTQIRLYTGAESGNILFETNAATTVRYIGATLSQPAGVYRANREE